MIACGWLVNVSLQASLHANGLRVLSHVDDVFPDTAARLC